MKISVTGGAGFIGKWLVRCLPDDIDIVIIDSLDPQVHCDPDSFSDELQERAVCIKASICDQDRYLAALEGTDVLVHLASQTGTGQSMYEMSRYVQQNVDGTAILLEAISQLQHKPRRIVLTSSRAVYGEGAQSDGQNVLYGMKRKLEDLQSGKWEVYDEAGNPLVTLPMQEDHLTNPTSVYGLTKLWQEQLIANFAKAQGIDYAFLRLQNVYGPEQELSNPYTGIIGIFTSLIVRKGRVELFEDGQMTRDFVYVKDVADALIKAIYYPETLEAVINVGSGEATSLEELVKLIAAVAAKEVEVDFSGRFRMGDIRHAVADISRYETLLSPVQTTSLKQGLSNYYQWYLEQNPLSDQSLLNSFQEMEEKNLLLKSK